MFGFFVVVVFFFFVFLNRKYDFSKKKWFVIRIYW